MTDRVVLITGTSSGFGRLMAETFARAGDRVFAGMRDPGGANDEARAALAAVDGVEVVALDVTVDAEVEAAVARVIAAAGRIDVLINNAGVSLVSLFECATLDQARAVFDVNYFGPYRMCRAALPHMRAAGSGLIVHISSIGGRVALPNSAVYCASKAALEMLGEVQQRELASHGIDVALVEPGAYGTKIFDKGSFGADAERIAAYGAQAEAIHGAMAIVREYVAQGPDPQEVADAVLELANTDAGARPLRVPVGVDAQGLPSISAATDPIVAAMFAAYDPNQSA